MSPTQDGESIYQALDATISEIRVLTLQSSQDQELRCTMKTVSLDNQPAFHALSYVWGSGTEEGRINIHGHVVPVTSSLATVLRHFRAHHYAFLQLHSLPLWIDAICINQADLDERSQQVRLMGRIYRQASRVLLWIGEGDELSDHAFDRMNDATFRASCGELKTTSRVPTLDEVRVKIIIERNLEARRYWTRTWILQEVVLATQDPVLLCGSRRIFWSWYTQCKKGLPFNKSAYPNLAFDWAAVQSGVPLHQDHDVSRMSDSLYHEVLRDAYWESGSIPFGNALALTVKMGATNPRDHVYGGLGLVPHRDLLLVDVDYRKTPERVFRDAMAAIWTSGVDGLISGIIPGLPFGLANDKSELPSWSPDFSRQTMEDYYDSRHLSFQSRKWRPERQAVVHVEDSILTVKAIEFDSIADTSMVLDFNFGWSETMHRGNAPTEVNIEPLQDIEAMAQRGRNISIPALSHLAPFLVLRDKFPIWSLLTAWREDALWISGVGGSKNDEWLPGVIRDRQKLWEILLGRQQIPEAWKMACSPELRNDLPALEAAILSPLLHSIRRKAHGKKTFISRSGFLGVGTKHVEAGDIVVLIAGMKCMYVLRPFRDGYHMVGFANVLGLMNWDDLDEAIKASPMHEEELKIY